MGIGGFKFPDASNSPFLVSQWLNVRDVSWAQITKNPVFSSLNFFLYLFAAQNFATYCQRPQLNEICYYWFVCFVSIYKLLWCWSLCTMHYAFTSSVPQCTLIRILGQGVSVQLRFCQETVTLDRHCSMIQHCSHNRKSSGKRQMLFLEAA